MSREQRATKLRNRLKSTLILKGESVASWARQHGFTDSHVWMNLSGERYSHEIRSALAAELKMSKKKLDAELALIAAQRAAEREQLEKVS